MSNRSVNYGKWDNMRSTSYHIPFIREKAIRLTNAGKASTAVVSTNAFDSIWNHADGILPIRIATGMAVKESTLGNPTDDKTAWNMSSGIRREFNNKYPGTVQHINYGHSINEQDLINYHKGQITNGDSKGQSILRTAFEFYRDHPDAYNPGQKNYQELVEKRGDEIMQSPEVQKHYREWERSKAKIFKPEPYKIKTNIQNTAAPVFGFSQIGFKKKGGKTHKPFGHRSILDNGWQSTKQLKNKKNVYGK